MTRSRRNGKGDGYPGFIRLHRGLIHHLPHFADAPHALVVYNWALLTSDHRTGLFVADRRDISNQCGLSQWQTKRALAWLAHGRGCECTKCRELPRSSAPSYIRLEKPASRGRPPLYYIRKHDSARRRRARQEDEGRQEPLDLPEPPEEGEDDGPDPQSS